MATVRNNVNQLTWNVPIVNPNGTPTDEFMRKWLQQGSQNSSITDLSTAANVSAVLDLISAVKGSTLYRGATQWLGLGPATGHDGYLLTFNNTSGLPEWRSPAITGIPAAIWIDGAGVGYMALVDVDGLEVLDASGKGIYIPNPLLPTAMVPGGGSANPTATGSDTAVNGVATTFMTSDSAPAIQKATNAVFGLAKVDDVTIQAVAGLIGTKFSGFLAQRTTNQAVTDSVYTKCVLDTLVTNTLGTQYAVGTGIFTPTRAGKYFVFGTMTGAVAAIGQQTNALISKNGTFGAGGTNVGVGVGGTANAAQTASGVAMSIVSMNGSTDTLELDGIVIGTGGSDVFVGNACFFGVIYLGA